MKNRRAMGRVELILQASPSENGAAALAMVLSYFGAPASVRELMERPVASAADLVAAAQRRGICAQGYRMTFDQLCQAPMPLVAHWKFRAFVVVTGIRGGRVYVNSPEEGRLVLSRQDFEAGFTGAVVCFAGGETPADGENALPGERIFHRGPAVTALLAAAQVMIAALCLVLAIIARSVAAQLSSPQAGNGLPLCLGLLAAVLLSAAAAALQAGALFRCRRTAAKRAETAFRDFLEGESTAFFEKTSCYRLDVAARGCGGVPAAEEQTAACALQLTGGAVCLAVAVMQNAAAGAAAAVVAAIFAAACCRRREALYSDVQLADRGRFQTADTAAEDLETLGESRLRGEVQRRFQRWAGLAGGMERPEGIALLRQLWRLAAAVQLLLVLLICLMEMIAGRAGTADLTGCLALTAGAAVSMGALPQMLQAQMEGRWLKESSARTISAGGEDAPAPSGLTAETLTLQNVSLRRNGSEETAARGITFTVRQGEILVAAGEREVRDALAVVAAGLERPRQGDVYLGRMNAAALSQREICGNIVLLGGGLPFPRGTVRENIAAGLPWITDYAVMESASDALLHQSILQRKSGYDTPVDTLSKGEQILLEFACAFARGTPFLICNGLTGWLDADTEDRLIRTLRRRGVGAVLLTEDLVLLRKGDLACRIQQGEMTLRERGELVGEEVQSLA